MTLVDFNSVLIETIKQHLNDVGLDENFNVLNYDGRFDDEQLASQIVARDKVIMVDLSDATFDARPASEKVYDVSFSANVSIYVALTSVAESTRTRQDAVDACRRLLNLLFVYPPVSSFVGVQSSHSFYRPSSTGLIQKVFQSSSGYSVARLDLLYKLTERWQQ